jgi:hypothetical protein
MNIKGYKDKHEYISDKGVISTVYLMDCMHLIDQVPKGWLIWLVLIRLMGLMQVK